MAAAPTGYEASAPFALDLRSDILADVTLSDGRHVVLGDLGGHHHLWIRDPEPGRPLAYVIPRDGAMVQRTAATRRLDLRLSGVPPGRCPDAMRPTAFQARRLQLLLDILDALLVPDEARPSTHEIADRLIYPRLAVGRSAEWKASSERRRTQRLIEEALTLMNGGYRALLQGRSAGATKGGRPK